MNINPQIFLSKANSECIATVNMYYSRHTTRMRSVVAPRHTLERPWTEKYWSENPVSRVGKGMQKNVPVVEPIREQDWMWFRGDRVEILTGPDKGKQGYINMIVQV